MNQPRQIFRPEALHHRFESQNTNSESVSTLRPVPVLWVILAGFLIAIGGSLAVGSSLRDQVVGLLDWQGSSEISFPAMICWGGVFVVLGAACLHWRTRRGGVPFVAQMTATECGAACLAMVLRNHGRAIELAECRAHCDAGRDGVTAQSIVRAARHFGLEVKAWSLANPSEGLHATFLPAIVHWNFNHFVVVEKWTKEFVSIADPAIGRRTLPMAEFEQHFTGILLTFQPGPNLQKRHRSGRSWLTPVLRVLNAPGTLSLLGQILLASIFLQIIGLGFPLLTKVLVDDVLLLESDNLMTMLGIGIVVVVLGQMTAGYLRSLLLIHLQAKLDDKLMTGFFQHVLSLPYRFFQGRSSGDLLMRLGSNAAIREMLTNQLVSAILDGALVIGYFTLIFLIHPLLGSVVGVLGLLQVALLLGTARKVHELTEQDLSTGAASQGFLIETLTGIATVKACGAEVQALDHWSGLFHKQLGIGVKRDRLMAIVETAHTGLHTFAPLLLLWFGILQVMNGQMSLGVMLAANALAASVLAPLGALVSGGQQLQLVGAHLQRIADVLETESEQNSAQAQPVERLSGAIELRNVSFHYQTDGPPALDAISLTVKPGEKIALVGPSGSGKTTLGRLLLGMYEPTGGEILYDGQISTLLELKSLRQNFGVVLQEPSLMSGSIRQNIAFGRPRLTMEQIREAARQAGIHDEIERMPMRYETILSEGGAGLSGGQCQRLALARALASRPAVLLLDEATSHLDVVTEEFVERNLSALRCTRIVIAHRLSTIRNADQILVMEQGCIVERGTHAELMSQRGAYFRLVQGQSEPLPFSECTAAV